MAREFWSSDFEDGERRSPVCRAFARSLDLYLEGELGDAAEASRVREHLAECSACAEYAERYDALTRAILESGGFGGEPLEPEARLVFKDRIDRAVEAAIGPAECRRSLGAELLVVFARRSWRRFAAAAVLILAFGFAAAIGHRHRPSVRDGAGAPFARASLEGDFAVFVAGRRAGAPDAAFEFAAPADGPLRWLLYAPGPHAGSRGAGIGQLRLYGFRSEAPGEPDPARAEARIMLEWIVEAAENLSRSLRSPRRFFVVPESAVAGASREGRHGGRALRPFDGEAGFREIFPVSWFPAELRQAEAQEAVAGLGAERAKRVRIVVVERWSLEDALYVPWTDLPAALEWETEPPWGLLLR